MGSQFAICKTPALHKSPPDPVPANRIRLARTAGMDSAVTNSRFEIGTVNDPLELEADRVADTVMHMPDPHSSLASGAKLQRTCSAREEKGQTTDRIACKEAGAAAGSQSISGVPPIVNEVLNTPGQPLDTATRAFMEPRFGHDFSRIRIHTDNRAVESTRTIGALAYAAGHEVVFGASQYAPATIAGRRLLAHELTHVVQQREAASGWASSLRSSAAAHVGCHAGFGAIQKAPDNALDETAKKIIEAAKDTTKSIDERAIRAVNDIVKAYYDPALVEKIVYDEKDPGLTTSPSGKGKDIKGQITVGKYFIDNIGSFARRVLQVGHELQHVQQQREGKGGPAMKNQREFLAFYWEATQPEKAGTGRMPHASRVDLIDAALKNYYCMPDADQKTYADKKDELLKLRSTEESASGNGHTDPPSVCPT